MVLHKIGVWSYAVRLLQDANLKVRFKRNFQIRNCQIFAGAVTLLLFQEGKTCAALKA